MHVHAYAMQCNYGAKHLRCYNCPFQNICLSNVNGTSFMYLTSLSIYNDHWKSFMKFGIKKSHEMISYIFA
jgi:hypothetical protein